MVKIVFIAKFIFKKQNTLANNFFKNDDSKYFMIKLLHFCKIYNQKRVLVLLVNQKLFSCPCGKNKIPHLQALTDLQDTAVKDVTDLQDTAVKDDRPTRYCSKRCDRSTRYCSKRCDRSTRYCSKRCDRPTRYCTDKTKCFHHHIVVPSYFRFILL